MSEVLTFYRLYNKEYRQITRKLDASKLIVSLNGVSHDENTIRLSL